MDEYTNEQSGESSKTNVFAYFDKFQFVGIEQRLKAGEYVYPEEMATALERCSDHPLPDTVKSYLCSDLRRELKVPRGRRAAPEIIKKQYIMFARVYYREKLEWLQKRRKRYGHLKGWTGIQGADFWDASPSEIALRMTARRFSHGADSWATIRNLLSSQK